MDRTLVAVITQNRRESLALTMGGLLACREVEDFDILIVDDASTDGTEAVCREWAEKQGGVSYRRNLEVRGVGAAKNAALRYFHMHRATHDLFVIAEDDVRFVRAGWVALYREIVEEGTIQHLNFLPEEAVPPQLYPPARPDSPYPYGVVLKRSEIASHPIAHWSDIGGAVMVLSRVVLEQVGGFDPRFRGRGFNHVDYSNRAAMAGLTTSPPAFGGDSGWAHASEAEGHLKYDWLVPPTHGDFGRLDAGAQARLAHNFAVLRDNFENRRCYNGAFLGGA